MFDQQSDELRLMFQKTLANIRVQIDGEAIRCNRARIIALRFFDVFLECSGDFKQDVMRTDAVAKKLRESTLDYTFQLRFNTRQMLICHEGHYSHRFVRGQCRCGTV